MTSALYRVLLPSGDVRWAAGTVGGGPSAVLEEGLDDWLSGGRDLRDVAASTGPTVPDTARVLAPVDTQEVWAAGVTYARSRDERMAESESAADVYDLVYAADRPELFFKAAAWRVRGPGEPIGIRADSTWDVPEPELAVVVSPDGRVAGYTIGNDVSSRSIEGANPLYLPQAKVYDASCALGPCIVPASDGAEGRGINLEIERDGVVVSVDSTSTDNLHRTTDDLARWLVKALTFPVGAILMTGTGIVPTPDFTLQGSDVVRISISGLGTLSNPVVVVGNEEGKPS